jgi:hypothetical protein
VAVGGAVGKKPETALVDEVGADFETERELLQ